MESEDLVQADSGATDSSEKVTIPKEQAKRKAFSVHDEEGSGVIVFAKSGIAARRIGANGLDCEFESVSCRRARWADEFAETGIVPAAAMVTAGWWLTCTGCERQIADGNEYDPDEFEEEEDGGEQREFVPMEPTGTQHFAFCHPECEAKFRFERALLKRAEKRAFKIFAAEASRKYPGIEICPEDGNRTFRHHAYVSTHSKSHRRRVIQLRVAFRFPGCKVGDAHYCFDLDYEKTKGERSLMVCNGDKAAWDLFIRNSVGRVTFSNEAVSDQVSLNQTSLKPSE